MRFYTHQHKFYCGIDLHARTMYLCILDQEGKILLHRDIKTDSDIFLKSIAPYREDVVVAVECIFTCTGWPISVLRRISPLSLAMPSI